MLRSARRKCPLFSICRMLHLEGKGVAVSSCISDVWEEKVPFSDTMSNRRSRDGGSVANHNRRSISTIQSTVALGGKLLMDRDVSKQHARLHQRESMHEGIHIYTPLCCCCCCWLWTERSRRNAGQRARCFLRVFYFMQRFLCTHIRRSVSWLLESSAESRPLLAPMAARIGAGEGR